jgi:hypothetical protein
LQEEQGAAEVECKICLGGSTRFDLLDFERSATDSPHRAPPSGIPVIYRKCQKCGFIFSRFFDSFTPAEWREHVYNDDYIRIDPEFEGDRPARTARAVQAYFGSMRESAIGLDYGGGNGLTASHLRNANWNFDCYDPFGLDETKAEKLAKYNFCISFETFEHFPDPIASMQTLLAKVTRGPLLIFVVTWLNDSSVSEAGRLGNWVYAGPRNGHISLYSRAAMRILANRFGLELTSIHDKGHLMSRGHDCADLKKRMRWGRYRNVAQRLLRAVTAASPRRQPLDEVSG